jgi:guanine deaminase
MDHEMDHERWMKLAIEQAERSIALGQSPFGSVIVRRNELVAAAHNEVWKTTDPSCHAEVNTIRKASAALGTINLAGGVLYSTCEPCPMCASAIHWANLDAVCYGATIADAKDAGFSELEMPIEELYSRGGSKVKILPRVMPQECANLFPKWIKTPGTRKY